MLTAVDIINALQQPLLHIDGIGGIRIYPESIIAGSISVASRCRIVGIEGDFLLKCFYDASSCPRRSTSHSIASLKIYTLSGRVCDVRCLVRRWLEGRSLDQVLRCEDRDLKCLSRAFDTMALRHLQTGETHGDISPYNIICSDTEMTLIDNDTSYAANGIARYGTPPFSHPHRSLYLEPTNVDDYAIATLSTILAAVSHYAKAKQAIPQILRNEITKHTLSEAIRVATDKLREVGDMAHLEMALTIKGSTMRIERLKGLIIQALATEDCVTEVKGEI
ncbi:MAG: hypothetical protein J6Q95_07220 [Alistipes sp.]|nr:hypothetical protein [Alistipes sp.]